MSKKVLLVVIDALDSDVVRPAMEEGRLPNIKSLIEAGWVDWDCTTIFPSITPAATCSIITGCYPCEHGIAGAYWYDTQSGDVAYYGDDIWPIMRLGMGKFFEDFLIRLNEDRLRVETLFEAVERAGMRAACLNYLWFHGTVEHQVNVPLTMSLLPGVPLTERVHGPTVLALGDFVTTKLELSGKELSGKGGALRRYGFQDDTTGEYLLQLAEFGPLPNFTLAYFPDNDFEAHDVGIRNAVGKLENVDQWLGRLADLLGGMDRMLDELAVVITGDHSQSDTKSDAEGPPIPFEKLLGSFQIVKPGTAWSDGDELMICPNMRAAQIYLRGGYVAHAEDIARRLLVDPRIDQVMWRDGRNGDGGRTFHVATRDRGSLTFRPDRRLSESARDDYGTVWSWDGSLRTIDARVEDGRFRFGDYPNALERIACGFDAAVTGDLWVTSHLGYEFQLEDSTIHKGGSHGSLHRLDSIPPLIISGAPDGFEFPQNVRTVDVAPVCLSLLGLPHWRPVGAGHVHTEPQS